MTPRNPAKVLMLASSYPRSHDDTASIFLRELAEHLQSRGLIVHVLAPAQQSGGTRSENGITVHRFRYFLRPWQTLAYGSGILPNLRRNSLLWCQVPFFILFMTFALLRLLHRVRPDIVHAHWVVPPGFIAVLTKLVYKTRVIITVHGGDAFALKNTLIGRAKRLALRHSDAWTSNTLGTAKALDEDNSLPPPHIIPMGVNIQRFASGDGKHLREVVSPNTSVVLFVGRLVEKKGADDLIRAYCLLPTDLRLRSELWIVGGGEQELDLHALVSELGAVDRVKFLGRLPNDRLPNYYAAADLFVGPSVVAESGDTEGQGVVFLEAFAAQLCVLATNTGGISEVIEDGKNGILVAPRSPKQLANAMAQLLTDEQRRHTLAANAYEKVWNAYDWSKIAMAFDQLYQSVLTNPPGQKRSIVDHPG